MILTQKCFPESTAGEQEPRKQISLSTSSLSLSPHCCELRKGATIPAPEQERGSTGSVWKGNFLGRTRQCQNSPLAPSPGHKPALRAQSPKLECRIKLRFLPLLWDSFPLVSPFPKLGTSSSPGAANLCHLQTPLDTSTSEGSLYIPKSLRNRAQPGCN